MIVFLTSLSLYRSTLVVVLPEENEKLSYKITANSV